MINMLCAGFTGLKRKAPLTLPRLSTVYVDTIYL